MLEYRLSRPTAASINHICVPQRGLVSVAAIAVERYQYIASGFVEGNHFGRRLQPERRAWPTLTGLHRHNASANIAIPNAGTVGLDPGSFAWCEQGNSESF